MVKQVQCVTAAVCLAIVAQGPKVASAGELNPPPGPIQPTNRVQLNEQWTTLPYTITEPGSYVLTSNLSGTTGDGIAVQADDVTLDLNGFALIGGLGSGVSVASGVKNLAVRNGTIRGWGSAGIDLDNGNRPINCLYENLRVSGNGTAGLRAGNNSRVINCGAIDNGDDGFTIGSGSVVVNCVARDNAVNGFVSSENCVFVDCSSMDNGPSSFADGFQVWPGSILTGCAARGNTGHGIIATGAGQHVTITGCTATSNALFGIKASDSLIRGNTVKNNAGGQCDTPNSTLVENHGCP